MVEQIINLGESLTPYLSSVRCGWAAYDSLNFYKIQNLPVEQLHDMIFLMCSDGLHTTMALITLGLKVCLEQMYHKWLNMNWRNISEWSNCITAATVLIMQCTLALKPFMKYTVLIQYPVLIISVSQLSTCDPIPYLCCITLTLWIPCKK